VIKVFNPRSRYLEINPGIAVTTCNGLVCHLWCCWWICYGIYRRLPRDQYCHGPATVS